MVYGKQGILQNQLAENNTGEYTNRFYESLIQTSTITCAKLVCKPINTVD